MFKPYHLLIIFLLNLLSSCNTKNTKVPATAFTIKDNVYIAYSDSTYSAKGSFQGLKSITLDTTKQNALVIAQTEDEDGYPFIGIYLLNLIDGVADTISTTNEIFNNINVIESKNVALISMTGMQSYYNVSVMSVNLTTGQSKYINGEIQSITDTTIYIDVFYPSEEPGYSNHEIRKYNPSLRKYTTARKYIEPNE